MPNFTIIPKLIQVTGARSSDGMDAGWYGQTGSSDADLENAIVNGTVTFNAPSNSGIANAGLKFGIDTHTPLFSLDDEDPISYNNLPDGFQITGYWVGMSGGTSFPGTFNFIYDMVTTDIILDDGFESVEQITKLRYLSLIVEINASLSTTWGGPESLVGLFALFGFYQGGTYEIIESSEPTDDWSEDPNDSSLVKYGPLDDDDILLPIAPIWENPITGELQILPIPDINGNPPRVAPPAPWIPWIPEIIPTIIRLANPIPLILPVEIVPIVLPIPPPIPYPPIVTFNPIIFIPIPNIPFLPGDGDGNGDGDFIPHIPVELDDGYTINVGGEARIVFIGSPSGIYTLIPGKTNDTLYDRTGAVSVDVKIPNPFVVTGFLGK